MNIRIYSLSSGLHAEAMSETARDPFIREIRAALAVAIPGVSVTVAGTPDAGYGSGVSGAGACETVSGPEVAGRGPVALDLIYIRTGGTEGAFKAAFTAPDGRLALPEVPVLLLTSGKSNSLAASMEILSFLRQQGRCGEILHGPADYIAARILALAEGVAGTGGVCDSLGGRAQKNGENLSGKGVFAAQAQENGENLSGGGVFAAQAQENGENLLGRVPFDAATWKLRLQGKRLGLVGRPSDWLIASDVDPEVARCELGLELVDIPMTELIAEIRKGGYVFPDKVSWPGGGPITEAFRPRFGRTLTPEAFEGAMEIYGALCRLVERYRLDGLTLRCFDLLTEVGNTGCMALAMLNAQGIPASCEGDVPALISMLAARTFTGCSGFQANPARIDPQTGEILLAHCTVPLDMIRCGEYDTHFESGIGVAVRGELPEGAVTLFKVAPDLRQCFAVDATLVRNQAECNLCRTQVVVKAPGTAHYFLTDSIGNHHIIVTGHHAAAFRSGVAG